VRRTTRWILGTGAAGAITATVLALRAAPARERTFAKLERASAVRRDMTSAVKATGVVKPMVGAEVRVGSRASGVVKRLLVKVGDAVVQGDLLAELDARDLAARREQAAAAHASSRAELAYARADLERKRRLAGERLLSASDLELAERAYEVARTREAEAAASLSFAATQLGYASLRAPIAGVVASISTQEGETVAASLAAPTFVTLLDLSRLEVWAYVDETDIGRVKPGQEVTFTVDTYPGQEFTGSVVTVYPKAEIRDNVVDYVAVIRFRAPPDRVLRPEMTAAVRIALETRVGVLTIPRAAVRREDGRAFVNLPRGGAVEKRWVRTGRADEGLVEVVDGLVEGDEVLVGEPEKDAEERS